LFKGLDLGRGGRQTGQIQGGAADQVPSGGRADRMELAAVQRGQDKGIVWLARPAGIGDRRGIVLHGGLESPLPPLGFHIDDPFPGRLALAGVRGAEGHPLPEGGDLGGGEPLLWRHLELGIGVADRADEQALFGLAGDHHQAAVPTFLDAFTGVEQQTALEFAGPGRGFAVALVTMLHQQRPHPGLEEFERGRVGFGRCAGDHDQRQQPAQAHSVSGRRGNHAITSLTTSP
jgi:hypothetical protein